MMKHYYLSPLLLCLFLFQALLSYAQVDLPYTLTFTADDAANWTDGIAEDGQGGAADINGLDLQVYTAATDHTTLYPGSVIIWHDNNYFSSSDPSYTGITSGPDITATNNGVPAMVIKSASTAINFSLQSIQLYDWGYDNVITIESYDNSVLVGSVDFTPDPSFTPTIVSQSDLLIPAFFNNVDEVRFFPKAPNTIFNLSMNNIALAVPVGAVPVTFSSITARQQNKNIAIDWKVENESGITRYEVERSANGQSFKSIGMLNAGAGYGGTANYHWLDENVLPGNNFYRIKTTDISGKLTYTSVIKIYAGHTKSALLIYPNPAPAGIVHLQMNDMPAGTYHAKLMNSTGKTMLVKTVIHSEGNSNEALNFSNLPKGLYILEVIHPDHTTSKSTIVY